MEDDRSRSRSTPRETTSEAGAGPGDSTRESPALGSTAQPTRSWSGWTTAARLLGLPAPGATRGPDADGSLGMSITLPETPLIRVPGFDVIEKVGQGGMGIVYKARKQKLGNLMALKVLPPGMAADPLRLERFLNEARIAAQLADARVLPVLDMHWVDGVPVLEMPFIEGSDLGRILRERAAVARGRPAQGHHPWSTLEPQAFQQKMLPLLDQLIDGVVALHEAHVIHRDIKPSNCLVDARGNLWLSDFGLAKLNLAGSDGGLTGRAELGTPGYMSPEAWDARDDVDARSDVFSLGATLYQCLTFELPYGRGRISADASLPSRPLRRHPWITPETDVVIVKAIEPDRARRYNDAVQLREDWRRARAGLLPVHARPPGLLRLAGSQIRRRRALWLGAAPVGLGLLGLAAAPWFLPRPPIVPNGLRRVRIDTTRPSRRFACIPLAPDDGRPLPDSPHAVRGRGGDRVLTVPLQPGLYLLVIEWPDGRFHEVIRTVPHPGGTPGLYTHDWFDDRGDLVEVTVVEPPPDDVLADMISLPGVRNHRPWSSRLTPMHATPVSVPPFFLSAHEFTVGEYLAVRAAGKTPPGLPPRMQPLGPNEPWPSDDQPIRDIEFDVALHYAELSGRRLPTLYEYQCAAGPEPSGNAAPTPQPAMPDRVIHPVSDPRLDRASTMARLVGLRSNVGEWTTTWVDFGGEHAGDAPRIVGSDLRIVFGVPAWVAAELGGPDDLKAASPACVALTRRRHWMTHGGPLPLDIGFRGCRSARPPYLDLRSST